MPHQRHFLQVTVLHFMHDCQCAFSKQWRTIYSRVPFYRNFCSLEPFDFVVLEEGAIQKRAGSNADPYRYGRRRNGATGFEQRGPHASNRLCQFIRAETTRVCLFVHGLEYTYVVIIVIKVAVGHCYCGSSQLLQQVLDAVAPACRRCLLLLHMLLLLLFFLVTLLLGIRQNQPRGVI